MPPPKRPFTTSSLTSTLKSTIASQPLLSNLTNIDKLSSQASSLAQKTPFFGTNQQQQHNDSAASNHQQQQGLVGGSGGQGQGMMRGGGQLAGAAGQNATAAQRPPMASTPTVDMSHLTEEERLMIQSVMVKAEMADMGMPVDTSAPSSTNLPSHTSQVLTQQTLLQQQQQQINQQQQQQINQQQQQQAKQVNLGQQQNQMNQQQQELLRQQQQAQMNMNLGFNNSNNNVSNNINNIGPMLQNNNLQQHQGMGPTSLGNNQQTFNSNSSGNNNKQQLQVAYGQNMQPLQVAQASSIDIPGVSQAKSMLDARGNNNSTTVSSLGEQAQQLVNQINSQFNLGQNQRQQQAQSQLVNQMTGMQQNVPQQQLVNQQSSQQLQNQQQAGQHQQQLRFQQVSNATSSFDQSMLSGQNVVQRMQPTCAPNATMFNQTSIVAGQRQQPIQPAQQLNAMMDDQARLMQANAAGSLQMDFLDPTQVAAQQQQQAHMLATYNNNSTNSSTLGNHQNLNQMMMPAHQMDLMRQQQQQDSQSTSNEQQQLNLVGLPQSQLAYHNAGNELLAMQQPQQQQFAAAPNVGAKQVSSQVSATYADNQNELLQQQRHAYQQHDPRSDIRFGPAQAVAFAETDYNEQALSDQEFYGGQHSHRHHQQLGRNVRRFDSAEQNDGSQRNSGAAQRHFRGQQEQFDAAMDMQPFDGRDSRTIQVYDLAQRSPQTVAFSHHHQNRHTATKSRQLPQPHQLPSSQLQADHSLQSSTEQLHHQQQQQHQNSRSTREISLKNSAHTQPRKAASSRDSKHESSPPRQYISGESEEGEEEVDERQFATTKAAKKSDSSGPSRRCEQATPDLSKETSDSGKGNSGGSTDKNNEALRILSELKLSEQANQVMEQQQLLIKQSQELIKLQLEQQALSQELKKSIKINQSGSEQNEAGTKNDKEDSSSAKASEQQQQDSSLKSEKNENSDSKQQQQQKRQGDQGNRQKFDYEDEERQAEAKIAATSRAASRLETSKKSTSFCEDRESDFEESPAQRQQMSKSQQTAATATATTTTTDDDGQSEQRRSRLSGRERITKNASNLPVSALPSARYNRDLLQSPTDTTDSDIEPISQANLRRQQQQQLNQGKQKKTTATTINVVRRREPTGLPPSPLPVAAAIQLHQMQQQHFRSTATAQQQQQQRGGGNLATANQRASNFMRSRSVTSSPNHHMERTNSGYMTDHHLQQQHNQRVRSVSPDTLSEFGGLRRRKRLPEPPTNTVPITPSMVRKMIQAQRAGATPSKLLTSVNAQTTLLTNTHSSRNMAFERPPTAATHEHNHSSSLSLSQSHSNSHNHGSSSISRAYQHQQPHNELLQSARLYNHASASNNGAHRISGEQSSMLAANQHQQSNSSIGAVHLTSAPTLTAASTNSAASGSSADLNKFLSSTYGNSILRNNNISDVKETPELDKLISNLDEYYGLDSNNNNNTTNAASGSSKRHVRLAHSAAPATAAASIDAQHPPTEQNIASSSYMYNQPSSFAASSSNFASLVASPTRALSGQNYPHGFQSSLTKSILYPASTAAAANGSTGLNLRRGSEGEYNFASSAARFAASNRSPYRTTTTNLVDDLRATGYLGAANAASSRANPLTSASSAYLNGGRNSYLNSSSPVRQSRYSNQAPTTTTAAMSTRDYPMTAAPSTANDYLLGKFERPTSSAATLQSQSYRPTSNKYNSSGSRLLLNQTGSFDAENLDYPSTSANHHHSPLQQQRQGGHSSILADLGAGSSASDAYYRQHYASAPSSNIDSIRDKYRYSSGVLPSETALTAMPKYDRYGPNDLLSRYHQHQSSMASESGESHHRRSRHMSGGQFSHQAGLYQQKSFDLDSRRGAYQQQLNFGGGRQGQATSFEPRSIRPTELSSRSSQYIEPMIDSSSGYFNGGGGNSSPLGYLGQTDYQMRHHSSYASIAPDQQQHLTGAARPHQHYTHQPNVASSPASFAPLTKDDIINNGPKFNSIGYRFRTENQNKYVAQARTSIQCLQSRYPHPYKRILLSKNPKDRIGNGIGVRITGGQPMPSLYDKVNRCIVTSGAFVTEVFQSSNVYFMGELHEGDQIIEWNGVNLCNRSNEEVQQILLSQFTDEEVEIVYLHQNKFNEAYGVLDSDRAASFIAFNDSNNNNSSSISNEPDPFEMFAEMNKSGHQTSMPIQHRNSFADETPPKGSIRRKISLSSIAHMWLK